jgi:hypothetical protein
MTCSYDDHLYHVNSGWFPLPAEVCRYCDQFIIQPAIREMRNDYRTNGRCATSIDDLDESDAD